MVVVVTLAPPRGHVVGRPSPLGSGSLGDVVLSVVLALVAAWLFAVSAALQQRAARQRMRARAAVRRRWLPVLDVLGALVRDRRWLVGWLANVAGFVFHAAALHLGSIAVVQGLLVVQLLFALALGGQRPLRRDWLGVVGVCAALVVLVVLQDEVRTGTVDHGHAAGVVAVAAAFVGGLFVAGRLAPRGAQLRSAVMAVAAGICFCLTAVLLVLVTDDVASGGAAALVTDWPLWCLVGSTVLGGLLVQDAFAAGSLATALTAMTITDPLASSAAGAYLSGAVPGPLGWYTVTGALLVAGIWLLAGSPTIHDERDRGSAPVRQAGEGGQQAGDGGRPGKALGGGAGIGASALSGDAEQFADAGGEPLRGAVGDPS